MVNKGQDYVTEKQQPFTFAGVGNVGKLMRADIELLCENLSIAVRLIEYR